MMTTKEAVERLESLNNLFVQVIGDIFLGSSPNETFNQMTGMQKRILFLLKMQGPQKMSDIARNVSVSLPSTTGVIDRMVRGGLVRRREDARDRRVTRIDLTEAGETKIAELDRMHRERFAEIMERLSPPKQTELINAFGTIHRLLKEIKAATEQDHANARIDAGSTVGEESKSDEAVATGHR